MTTPAQARTLWSLLEPIHAVTYFSPEPIAALRAAGYRGFWMGYVAGRAAPLGAASAELVRAVFFNFAAARIEGALPDAWGFAAPEVALAARLEGSVTALRRQFGDAIDEREVARVAGVLRRAAESAPLEGRPLYAANAALGWPGEPLAQLWHAATLLREHRGDGHVAALTVAGVAGREAHVLHALGSGTPREVYRTARDLEDEEWDALLAALADRGLVDDDGALSAAGRDLKRELEDRTDTLAVAAYAGLSHAEADDLVASLRPLATAVVASGDLPLDSPMGLDLHPLHDGPT